VAPVAQRTLVLERTSNVGVRALVEENESSEEKSTGTDARTHTSPMTTAIGST
jgi:hypothetical protein